MSKFNYPDNINKQNIQNEFLLNWNAYNNYWNDWTATNITWVKSEIWYVKEVGNFDWTWYITTWINWIPSWVQSYHSFWVNPTDLSEWDTFSSTNPRNILGMDTANTSFIRFLWDKVNVWVNDWSWHEYHSSVWSLVTNKWQFIEVVITPSSTVKCYIDWVEQWNDWINDVFPATWNNWNHTIWRNTDSTQRYYKWYLWILRSDTWITTHQRDRYLEWLKKFWPSILQQYPELFEWCVWYWDFKWDASNLIDWSLATVSWATLTTDQLGNTNSAYNFPWWSTWELNCWNIWNIWNNWTYSILLNKTADWTIDYIVSKNDASWDYPLTIDILDTYTVRWYYVDWWATQIVQSNTALPTWQWTLVTLVRNWWQLDLYYNDTLDNSATWLATNNVDNTDNFLIWNWTAASWRNFAWDVSISLLVKKSFTLSDVKQLYQLVFKKYIYPFAKYTPASLPKPILHINWNRNWDTFFDQSGNWNHWTQSGGVTSGRIGQSKWMGFDGVDDYISCFTDFWNSNQRTLSFKVKSNTKWNRQVMAWLQDSTDARFNFLVLREANSDYYKIYITSDLWQLSAEITNYTIKNNNYEKIVLSYNNWEVKFYVNWINYYTDTSLSWNQIWDNNYLYIWTDILITDFLQWDLSDIILYNSSLSPKQIEQDYYSNYI